MQNELSVEMHNSFEFSRLIVYSFEIFVGFLYAEHKL